MKIKNVLMQWIVMTPLTLIATIMSLGLIIMFTDESSMANFSDSMGGVGFIVIPLMCIGICFVISKILLRIKGKAVEYTYYENDKEYEITHDHGDYYTVRQTKGGWTTGTKLIVWAYVALSPLLFIMQIISNIFALVSLFNNRIASWYGAIDYDDLENPAIQKVLHFLFNFVVLSESHVSGEN